MINDKLVLGIYNVYSFYDGKTSKNEWLSIIKDEMIKEIAKAEFLYYEGSIIDSYNLLNTIINKAKKENNYDALIGAASLLCRVALVIPSLTIWHEGIQIIYDCYKHNSLLSDFMISCVYCSIDYYEFAIDFIGQKHNIPESWRPQYNYLLMATSNIDVLSSLDSIMKKKKSIIPYIQSYLIKAIISEDDDFKIKCIQKAFDISVSNGLIMPLIEMGMPLNRFYANKYIKNYSNELKVIKKICKSYANGITKVYTNNDDNNLTLKEFTALFFVAQGKKNKEIAKIMNISENTLKYYLKIAFEKSNISKRKQADKKIVDFNKNLKTGGEKQENTVLN